MNDSLSNLLKQGLAVTYWRFYCHIWQLLVQSLVISRLDYAMLLWLDFQTQSNLYKWFRMQRHDWSSTSQKEPMSLLSLSPCTGYHLQLTSSSRHWCLHIEQSQAQHPPTSTHYTNLPFQKSEICYSERLPRRYHHREAQNHSPEHSRSPFLAGEMIFPPPIRNAGSLSIFKQQLKTHLFQLYLTSS